MKAAFSRKNIWERLPRSIKAGASRGLSTIPPGLLLGRRFRRGLRLVQEAQWWPAERARQYQLERLRRVCQLAYDHSPYYRKRFDDVGFDPRGLTSPENFSELPTIDRTTVATHLEEMCTSGRGLGSADTVATGGTGNAPLRFHINANRSSIEYAHLVANWGRIGYRLRIPQAVLRGHVVAEDRDGLRHEYDPILRRHYYSNFHMSNSNIARYLDHMERIGPCFLQVYPSSAVALTRFLARSGRKPPSNILGLLVGSENVYPEDRDQAERVFGVRYFSWYGHTEKLVMAGECEESTDYHIWPTYGYFELLDEQGKLVSTAGERGEIVGTGFINTVVPFIRYRTGDTAEYVGDRCAACGREHLLIRDVRGHRTQEILVAADGSEISWTSLNMHDSTFDRVRQMQFYQETPGVATLRVVPQEGFSDRDRDKIISRLRRKTEDGLRVEIELLDTLPTTHSGKAIYVDQRIGCGSSIDADDTHAALSNDQRSARKMTGWSVSTRPRLAHLPKPPELPGTRVVTPVSVRRHMNIKPAIQIVYPNPIRKAATFLRQEGFFWTLTKTRSKFFNRQIASQAALVVVVGRLGNREDWCAACGVQHSPDLAKMLFRDELVFPAKDREDAERIAQLIAESLTRDDAAAQRLADFSHYSRERAPRIPGVSVNTAAGLPVDWARCGIDTQADGGRKDGRPTGERPLILVGAGDYAFTFVLPHLGRHFFDTVVDYNPIRAAAVARRFGFRHAETDYRRVADSVRDSSEPTVVIASYHSQHADTAIAFLEANRNACVMIEKPPVVGFEQLDRLLPYVRDRSRCVEMGFNRRYTRMIQRAAKELHERTKPVVMTCIVREDNMEQSHWYFWATEGSRVYGNLCHWVDLGVHLIGTRPVEIAGLAHPDFQSASNVVVRFEDDSLLSLCSSVSGSGHRGVQEYIDVRCGNLTMQIEDFRRMHIMRGPHYSSLRSRTRDKGHRAMYRALAETVSARRRARYPATDFVRTCVLTEEIYRMMSHGETQRKVDLAGWSTVNPEVDAPRCVETTGVAR